MSCRAASTAESLSAHESGKRADARKRKKKKKKKRRDPASVRADAGTKRVGAFYLGLGLRTR
jgi:hypothetical protein